MNVTHYLCFICYKIVLQLKVPTHWLKFKKIFEVCMPDHIRAIIVDDGMLSLVDYSFTVFDVPLLSTFEKQSNKLTFVLHIPFNKMMVALDDVFSLFHLFFTGNFFTHTLMN